MRIDLFKSFEGASYYGDVPESSSVPETQVESMLYGFDADWRAIVDFALKINDACDTALDISDVDFFDVQKCVKLVKLLDSPIAVDDGALAKFAVDLKVAAQRAIELGTGIVVEL